MENGDLATYLNDHLAGSVGAIEILDRLIATYENEPLGDFLRAARQEIVSDQEELRAIMKALAVSESNLRKAGAWIGEKFTRVKLGVAGAEPDEPGLALSLEALVLGIRGKELLWRVLSAMLRSWPPLQPFDLARLERRAAEQAARLDEKRIESAVLAFRPQ